MLCKGWHSQYLPLLRSRRLQKGIELPEGYCCKCIGRAGLSCRTPLPFLCLAPQRATDGSSGALEKLGHPGIDGQIPPPTCSCQNRQARQRTRSEAEAAIVADVPPGLELIYEAFSWPDHSWPAARLAGRHTCEPTTVSLCRWLARQRRMGST